MKQTPLVPIRVPGRRLAIFLSGRGTNMTAVLEAARSGRLSAEPVLVFSNQPRAAGLEIARQFGVPTEVLSHRKYRRRKAYDAAVLEILRHHRVDLICLAGFMRILSPVIVAEFRHRIVNVHPSLLPAFPGLDAHRQAIDYGARWHGATVHLVDEGLDSGPILLQEVVEVLPADTPESLAARVLPMEHRMLTEAIGLLVEGRVSLRGRVAVIAPRRGRP